MGQRQAHAWQGTPYNPDDPTNSNLANPTPLTFPADLDLNGALAGAPIELAGQSYGGFFEGSIIACCARAQHAPAELIIHLMCLPSTRG